MILLLFVCLCNNETIIVLRKSFLINYYTYTSDVMIIISENKIMILIIFCVVSLRLSSSYVSIVGIEIVFSWILSCVFVHMNDNNRRNC